MTVSSRTPADSSAARMRPIPRSRISTWAAYTSILAAASPCRRRPPRPGLPDPGAQAPTFVDEAQVDHAAVALFAQGVPAPVEAAALGGHGVRGAWSGQCGAVNAA